MPHADFAFAFPNRSTESAAGRAPRRPAWVGRLIEQATEWFEPLEGVARVGFDCRLCEDRWEVGLYVGELEIVGGPRDGQSEQVNFQFDLLQIMRAFSRIERLDWAALPQADAQLVGRPTSLLLVEGDWADHPVRLILHGVPPQHAGPGLRRFPDGRCEPV